MKDAAIVERSLEATQLSRGASGRIREDLVYDVGMHNGDDTSYYLRQGFNVLAIEADPCLVEAGRIRFARELRVRRLTILNVGIAAISGTGKFWICEEKPVWNSFDRSIAARSGMKHHCVEIPTRTFAEIIEEHGVPRYLKIDIEGSDHLCVRALAGRPLPRFISIESECIGEGEDPMSADPLLVLRLLRDVGYRRFKLIRQTDFANETGSDVVAFLRRLAHAAAFGRLQAPGVSRVAALLTHREWLRRKHNYAFPVGSSGPWGDGAPGPWLDFDKASATYEKARERFYRRADVATFGFWCDWHATY